MKHFSDAIFEELLQEQTKSDLDISNLCTYVNNQLFTFGGNCGSFALALYNKLTKLGHKVDLVICSNMYQDKESDWTQEDELDWYLNGEPDIYHVAIMLNKDTNKLFDGDGLTSIEELINFCYSYYGDEEATIESWSIENKVDYEMFYKIFRYNTNMSIPPADFEAAIDSYLTKTNLF